MLPRLGRSSGRSGGITSAPKALSRARETTERNRGCHRRARSFPPPPAGEVRGGVDGPNSIRRERMLDRVALANDLGSLRLVVDRAPDCFLRCPIVEVLDLPVVGRVSVDEHSDAD